MVVTAQVLFELSQSCFCSDRHFWEANRARVCSKEAKQVFCHLLDYSVLHFRCVNVLLRNLKGNLGFWNLLILQCDFRPGLEVVFVLFENVN